MTSEQLEISRGSGDSRRLEHDIPGSLGRKAFNLCVCACALRQLGRFADTTFIGEAAAASR